LPLPVSIGLRQRN
jgi:hypothetical protein